MAELKCKRPVLRYLGGKWRLASWIISYFPQHNIYVEPFGGAASVLLKKPRSYAEVYNDLDAEIVNVFRVLQDTKKAKKLIRSLELTLFARQEFEDCWKLQQKTILDKTLCLLRPRRPDIEKARCTIIKSFMGFSSDSCVRKYRMGFRNANRKSGTFAADDWRRYPVALSVCVERFRGVLIENKPAIEVMEMYDSPETLFYLDPPYVQSTRKHGIYRHEMSDVDHLQLGEVAKKAKGMVIVSGYNSELYGEIYRGWHEIRKSAVAMAGMRMGSKYTTEILWLSPNCKKSLPLFAGIEY